MHRIRKKNLGKNTCHIDESTHYKWRLYGTNGALLSSFPFHFEECLQIKSKQNLSHGTLNTFFGQNKYHLCTDAQNFFIWVSAPCFLIDSQNSHHYFSQSEPKTRRGLFTSVFPAFGTSHKTGREKLPPVLISRRLVAWCNGTLQF